VMLNIIPRDGGNNFSARCSCRAPAAPCRGTTTPTRSRPPAALTAGAEEGLRLQPDGRRTHRPRQAVVLPDLPRGVPRTPVPACSSTATPATHEVARGLRTRRPASWTASRGTRAPDHVADLPRNKLQSATPSSTTQNKTAAGSATRAPERRACALHPRPHSGRPRGRRRSPTASMSTPGWGDYCRATRTFAPRVDGRPATTT
jgi:hypothetical protein